MSFKIAFGRWENDKPVVESRRETEAEIIGPLAVHRAEWGEKYKISHAASGRCLTQRTFSRARALKLARKLAEHPAWERVAKSGRAPKGAEKELRAEFERVGLYA